MIKIMRNLKIVFAYNATLTSLMYAQAMLMFVNLLKRLKC